MNFKHFILATLAIVGIVATSCKKDEPAVEETLSVNPTSLSFSAAGGSESVTVTTTASWEAKPDADWLTVIPANDGKSFKVTAAANTAAAGQAAAARNATITVSTAKKKATIAVKQNAEDVVFKVLGDTAPAEFKVAGGKLSVSVEHNVSYEVSGTTDWLTRDAGTKAVATDNISFTVAANTGFEAREATLTFKPASGSATTIKVKQAAEAVVFTVVGEPTPAEFAEAGGTLVATVTYNVQYTVSIPAEAGWITEVTTKATQTDKRTFQVSANEGEARQADITFTPKSGTAQKVTVKQAAKTAPAGPVEVKITTTEQFVQMLTAKQTETNDTLFVLMNDLDMSGVTFDPVAAKTTFYATFDGQNHVIKNYTNNKNYLIYAIYKGGVFKNLVFDKSCTITMGGTAGCGLICYANNAGSIINIVNNADITIDHTYSATSHLGVICGINRNILDKCVNNGNVTIASSVDEKQLRFGGMVGSVANLSGTASGAEPLPRVTNCVNNGNINYAEPAGKGNQKFVGGIVGAFDTANNGTDRGIVDNCVMNGTIHSTSASSSTASTHFLASGGIVGYLTQGIITNCTLNGNMICEKNEAKSYTGGIVGIKKDSANDTGDGCKVKGNVNGAYAAGTGMVIGGFAGATALITFGTAASPIAISGKLNGADVTAENLAQSVVGTDCIAETHVFNCKVGGGESASGIKTADEFIAWLADPKADLEIGADLDFSGKTVTPGATLPEGVTLKGNGKTVKNLALTAALFATNKGAIKNLVFDSSCSFTQTENITASNVDQAFLVGQNEGTIDGVTFAGLFKVDNASIIPTKSTSNPFFGTLAARNTGLVSNCAFKGEISITTESCGSNAYYGYIGGLVGMTGNDGMTGVVTVKNCTSEGKISFIYPGTYKTLRYYSIGGVVGGSNGIKGGTLDCGAIEGCTNKSSIYYEYTQGGSGGYPTVGGVIGYFEGVIKGCNNYGKITVTNKTDAYPWTGAHIGGVAGTVTLGASDCHNYGTLDISGTFAGGTAGNRCAGIQGSGVMAGVIASAGKYTVDASIVFENCTNEAALKFTPHTITQSPNNVYGGVFGAVCGTVKNCHNNADVTVECPACMNRLGGIAGTAYCNIEGCTNKGNLSIDALNSTYTTVDKAILTPDSGKKSTVRIEIGGIAGDTNGIGETVTFKNCSNTGNLTAKSTGANVESEKFTRLGGILGAKKADVAATETAAAVVYTINFENCTNTGKLTNESTVIQATTGDTLGGEYN